MRDADVRNAVRARLEGEHAGDPGTLIVEEMGVWSGSVRIDIAVINGELSGFELKSDKDTLARLPTQVEIYGRVFDRLELVVGSKYAQKAAAMVPDWWGITVATEAGGVMSLASERTAHRNPSPDPYLVAELLNKEEAVFALATFGLAEGWRSKRIKLLHQRLAAEVPFQDLSFCVREILKRRSTWLRKYRPDQLNMAVDG